MKRKGFTIVELVIVIAVVAILAAVLIPTFSGIVKNANVSSDTQVVRNMNVVLSSEVAEGNVPAGGYELIAALKGNGFSDFSPKTNFYSFYWLKHENVIVLADEAGNPVYPEGYVDAIYDPDLWLDLESAAGMQPLPPAPSEGIENPREFTVTLSGDSGIDFNVPPTATEGEPLHLEFLIPSENELQFRYRIQKVSAVMENGEETLKVNVPGGSHWDGSFDIEEKAVLNIPNVTGNIRINVSLKEFCLLTLKNPESSHMKEQSWRIWCQKGMRLHINNKLLYERALKEGYGIKSAIAYVGGVNMGEVFDYETNSIHSSSVHVTDDVEIVLTTEWISYSVQLTVKDQHGNVLFEQMQTVSYDTAVKDVAYTFDLSEALAGKEFEFQYSPYMVPAITDEERKPIYNFNTDTRTVKITNINNDLKLTYFLNVKESTSQE